MGVSDHTLWLPKEVLALEGILVYISPGTLALWADVVSHSGLNFVA
jgi:hypothetical protein